MELSRKTHHRPDLRDITRKSALCSKARVLYDTTVKLKRQNRNLKRLYNKYKVASRSKTITLSSTDYKGTADSSASICQQFIDMVMRNNDVAPQVKFKIQLPIVRLKIVNRDGRCLSINRSDR